MRRKKEPIVNEKFQNILKKIDSEKSQNNSSIKLEEETINSARTELKKSDDKNEPLIDLTLVNQQADIDFLSANEPDVKPIKQKKKAKRKTGFSPDFDINKIKSESEERVNAQTTPISFVNRPHPGKEEVDKLKNQKKTNVETKKSDSRQQMAEKLKGDLGRFVAIAIVAFLTLNYVIGWMANVTSGNMSLNPINCIMKAFFIKGIWKFELALIALIVIVVLIKWKKKAKEDNRNLEWSKKDDAGSGGPMQQYEKDMMLLIESDYKKVNGIILGTLGTNLEQKIVALPWDSFLNRNLAICGSQGSMKSWGYVRNLITKLCEMKSSIIVTDPKGELYRDKAIYLEKRGYTVKQWNLKNFMSSDSWDCLRDVNNNNISTFVDIIIRNTSANDRFDPFYDGADMALLRALCLYVKTNPDIAENEKTFTEAYNMLLMYDEDELDVMFMAMDDKEPAKQAWRSFSKAGNAKHNAFLSLTNRLQILQNPIIQKIVSNPDIDLELPARKKCAYFIITSDQESTYDMLATLFISYLFIKIVNYADLQPSLTTDVPVHFVLDEFPNIGQIPDFKKKLATVRGRNIGCSLIFQNIPQLMNRYPNMEYIELLGGCDTQMLLACNDYETAKYYSNLSGTATVDVKSTRKQYNTIRLTNFVHTFSETISSKDRATYNPDEIMRLREENASLLWVGGSRPLKLDKFGFDKNPEIKNIVKQLPTEHIPTWLEELKEKTRWKNEYGGIYSLGRIEDLPEYFKPTFEKWRQAAFDEYEKKDSAFEREKQRISLTVVNETMKLIKDLNIEQGEEVYELINEITQNGTINEDTVSRLRSKREEKRQAVKEKQKVTLEKNQNLKKQQDVKTEQQDKVENNSRKTENAAEKKQNETAKTSNMLNLVIEDETKRKSSKGVQKGLKLDISDKQEKEGNTQSEESSSTTKAIDINSIVDDFDNPNE